MRARYIDYDSVKSGNDLVFEEVGGKFYIAEDDFCLMRPITPVVNQVPGI